MSEKQNSNVIVVQDNEEKKVRRLTLSSWAKGIVNYKWWVIGATALTGFAGFAGVKWGANRIRETLTVSYSYNLATESGSDKVERFVNGQVFDYSSVVSKEAYEFAKSQDESLANVDVDALYSRSPISVVRNINSDYDNEITYTLSAKVSAFKNTELGKKFMMGLIKYPLYLSDKAIDGYEVTSYILPSYNNSGYLEKAAAIEKQSDAISQSYNLLKAKYGESVAINDKGQTLNQTISYFEDVASIASSMRSTILSNYFVDYEEGKEAERAAQIENEAKIQIKNYETKSTEKDTKLELLKSMENATIVSTLTNESEYVKAMLSLKDEIESISKELSNIKNSLNWAGYIQNDDGKFIVDPSDDYSCRYRLNHIDSFAGWAEDNKVFGEKLSLMGRLLTAETSEASKTFHYVYSQNNSLTVWGSGNVAVANSIPWVFGLVGGLVLGFVVTSLITGTVQGSKMLKEEEK